MNGYLDKNGKLHECESFGHLSLAREIVVDEMKVSVCTDVDAEMHLLNLGWICIRTNEAYGLIGFLIDENKEECHHLTQKQKEWLNNAYPEGSKEFRETVDQLFKRDK